MSGKIKRIAVLGLGKVGTLAATLLHETGFEVTGFDVRTLRRKVLPAHDFALVHGGGRTLTDSYPNACYVKPAIVEMPDQSEIVRRETFAPIIYVMKYRQLSEAIALQNAVPQGLASCIFSTDVRETDKFGRLYRHPGRAAASGGRSPWMGGLRRS